MNRACSSSRWMPCELEVVHRLADLVGDLAGEPGELAVADEPVERGRSTGEPSTGRQRGGGGLRVVDLAGIGEDGGQGQRQGEVVAVAVEHRAPVGGEVDGAGALLLAEGLERRPGRRPGAVPGGRPRRRTGG